MKKQEILFGESVRGFEPLSEASRKSLNRVLHNIENMSYVIISSDRCELTKEENLKRFKRLKNIVKSENFSFIPIVGGYIETDEELFNFGLQLCQYDLTQQDENGNFIGDDPTEVDSFGQESFLYKGTGDSPAYYNKEGVKTLQFGDDLKLNDLLAEFFTQLYPNKANRRFTYLESFIPEYPKFYSETHIRYLEGELVTYI